MAAQILALRGTASRSSFDELPPYNLENWSVDKRHTTSEFSIKYQIPAYIVLSRYPAENYHLSKKEQGIFRSALRKSVKLLHKA